ncbi:hypothetical protein FACS1894217_11160 [Clostridia bacterium]|nr:hypothetical protein FACS1894217_11160 [Clostridia bacterium]
MNEFGVFLRNNVRLHCIEVELPEQKRFTTDFLTKKTKRNEGEYPQYYVENSHPAIISLETYDLVQDEMRRNSAVGCTRSAAHCFSTKVFCGECGGVFGSKTWHSTDKYKRTIWRCNRKYEFKAVLPAKHRTLMTKVCGGFL